MEQLMVFVAFLIVGSERLIVLVITSKVRNVLMCVQIIVLNIITVDEFFYFTLLHYVQYFLSNRCIDIILSAFLHFISISQITYRSRAEEASPRQPNPERIHALRLAVVAWVKIVNSMMTGEPPCLNLNRARSRFQTSTGTWSARAVKNFQDPPQGIELRSSSCHSSTYQCVIYYRLDIATVSISEEQSKERGVTQPYRHERRPKHRRKPEVEMGRARGRVDHRRWTHRLTLWDPRIGRRRVGRQTTRWADFFKKKAGSQWKSRARDRQLRRDLEATILSV
ncbi:hypothetical protein ANN_04747 [Periplaneta americana]|uniref:Uncharacterized protein n=1 Tax=Periplaneta americana TaxID=6978 RepID=A0ABQ8T996_PERAM|nr:hypothetical protein ANN_04747 [Periplaneta americana]